MGIFDGIRNFSDGLTTAASRATASNNIATGMSYYAPEFANYSSQLAGQAAAAAAQGREYAARSSALFDDAATRKGQLALDDAGNTISRNANNRQASVLMQLQQLADQRYARNADYLGQTWGWITRGKDIDVANALREANAAQRAAVSDAVGRGAVVSAGHRADINDIIQKLAWDRAGIQLGVDKQVAETQNRADNALSDYRVDAINRSNDFAGIGDANSRLDLDAMNNALMRNAADRNASNQASVLSAQQQAAQAQLKAQQDAIDLQRIDLFRRIAEANAAKGK